MQPSSLPVDRRARRAKTDVIDVEMLLRALMAWLRGEPRVCSMVPIPTETDEEARRAHREREDLTSERLSILNKIDSILATLGVKNYRALRRDRREQLALLRQPDGDPVPQAAQIRIERLLDRLELTLRQIKEVEAAGDSLVDMRAIANSRHFSCATLSRGRSPTGARSAPMPDLPGRHFQAAAASASTGSARTATEACERRWWNSPGCGSAGSLTAPCRLGSANGPAKPVDGSRTP